MKKVMLILVSVGLALTSCGEKKDNSPSTNVDDSSNAPALEVEEVEVVEEAPADPLQNKGVGPVKSVTLSPKINQEMAAKGKEIYSAKCTACHKPTKKFIGPAPKDILERRSPEWVMNMILVPEKMLAEDPIAKQLLAEANGAPMANQNLTEQEAREVLEYFRTIQ